MRKTISILFAALLFSSCNEQGKKETADVTYKIEFSEENEADINSIISNLKITELEMSDESLMSSITDIAIAKNRLYCFSNDKNGYIKVFDLEGKYLFSINHAGRAENEWIELNTMFVNEKENTILLTERNSSKILLYDLDGNFVKSCNLGDDKLYEVACHDGMFYSVTSSIYTGNKITDASEYKLNIFNEKGEYVDKAVKVKHNDSPIVTESNNQLHWGADGKLLLAPVTDETVYQLEGTKAIPYIAFNYQGKEEIVPDNVLDKKAGEGEFEWGSDYTFYTNRVLETDKLIYRRMGNEKAFDVLYDKDSGKTILTRFYATSQGQSGMSPNIIHPAPYTYYKGRFYSVFEEQVLGAPDIYINNGTLPEELKPYREKYQRGELNSLIISYEISL